ncbi:MAG: hypothetical protein ACOC2Y_07195 [Spirochaetota bacterium]
MKKISLLGILVLALVALSMSGCFLFPPEAVLDEVAAEDLGSYDASQTIEDDEDSVLAASTEAMGAAMVAPMTVYDESVSDELGLDMSGGQPSVQSLAQSLLQQQLTAVRSEMQRSRSVNVDDESDIDEETGDGTIDVTIEVSNETVNGSDIGESGTATINTFNVEVTGEISSSGDETGGTMSLDAELGHEGDIEYEDWTSPGGIVIHDGVFKSLASGEMGYDLTMADGSGGEPSTSGSISYDMNVELSAGFSYSNTDTGRGGKITMLLRYSGSDDVTFDSQETLPEEATGEIEATMTVKVYDNDNNLVVEHEFTDDELMEE